MKKLATTFTSVFLALSLFCQNQLSAHLTFKGVAIDGTLSEFVAKMKLNGFTLLKAENSIAILKGDFAGYKDCILGVTTLKQKDLVSKITVIFPDQETWSTLSSNYFTLKELLTQKYGKPSESVEKFDTYSEPDDDGDRIFAVKFDKCKYFTTFKTDKGTIKLTIEHEGVTSCFVMLSYFDKINTGIINENALNDL